ncbi:MAG: nucleotidyltransferase [Armatimonadota bacterium]|nr:nucleotidyltransferase [Armatimonadota bacterium]
MSILDTAVDIASFLDEQEIPYAVIGGLAVQYWGEARTTRDVDIVVLVSPDRIEGFLDAAVRRFKPRLQDAVSFAQTNRMLLLSDAGGTPVDIALGIPGYEEEVIRRVVTVTLPNNHVIRLIGPEDLIIHKCIAGRPRDREDIERILVRQRLSVDIDYIRQWLGEFVDLIEDHDVVSIFESALERASAELAQDTEA